MDLQELSDRFDLYYNNITSNQAPGLNEWEKSVFLTRGQEEVVKNYFNPKGNKYQEGFDNTAKRQADFSTLIETKSADKADIDEETDMQLRFTTGYTYYYPKDAFILLNEILYDQVNKKYYVVSPISYDEYSRLMLKPYKYPPKNQVWRLIINKWGTDNLPVMELIGRFDTGAVLNYQIRYVKRPKPIILINLSDIDNALEINGESTATPCELPEHLHEEILQRAVELAKVAWDGSLNAVSQAGQRSE